MNVLTTKDDNAHEVTIMSTAGGDVDILIDGCRVAFLSETEGKIHLFRYWQSPDARDQGPPLALNNSGLIAIDGEDDN